MENRINVTDKNLALKTICRRIHPRVKVSLPIYLKIKDSVTFPSPDIAAGILDLSEGGIGLTLKKPLPVNSKVLLNIDGFSFKAEALLAWNRPVDRQSNYRCGFSFLDADLNSLREIIGKVNNRHLEDFFGTSVPNYVKENTPETYLFDKFDREEIMKTIDFTLPFLKIEKMAVLGSNRQNIFNLKGLATGILTTNDTKGHYNDTIFLAQCGQLMGSAASIYLAILFPTTAPQVIEVDSIRPSKDKTLWKPSLKGSRFFIETHILKKKMQVIIVNVRITFGEIFMGEVERLKLILTAKNSIWGAKELPDWE